MTAPMIVANWTNVQYYASVVDNKRCGSGNKTLHNVTGGRIDVFEGNGGDLMETYRDGEWHWLASARQRIMANHSRLKSRNIMLTLGGKHSCDKQT